MGRLTPPAADSDGWITALYPIVCALHASPIPAGHVYRLDRGPDGQQRRICRACSLLDTVLGKPLDDPRGPK
jgi:hypothetical protein